MRYICDVENKKFPGMRLCRAELSDYGKVFAFLDGSRNALETIEFFYPYTREELENVLENGYFLCVLDKDEIVATFAVDTDEEYAKILAEVIRKGSGGRENVERAYEASGLMVREDHRGAGLASYLMSKVTEYADERGIDLCGVVFYLNKASISTFFGKKFLLSAIFEPIPGYKFVYLLKKFNFHYSKPEIYDRIKITEHEALNSALQKGFQGFALDGDALCFSEIGRKA